MKIWKDTYPLIISCARGLVPQTSKELSRLGYEVIDSTENTVVVRGNMRDMMTKGRKRVSARDGGRNPNAKLTAGQVKDIRELHASGWRYPALAERFDVSVGCIRSIALFENWRSA